MNISKQAQQLIIFGVLALLTYGIWNYYFNHEIKEVTKPFTKGYSVKNIELKITDDSGMMTALFKSPELIRYTDSPIIHITNPLFWTYEKGKQHWTFKSDKAEYNPEAQQVGLYDNLIAKTVDENSQMMFSAKNLSVDLNTKKAITSDGILMQQKKYKMTGQIAKFDLQNEILEVNNNVKASYKAKN